MEKLSKSKSKQSNNKFRMKKNINKLKSCAYFGILDCSCCTTENKIINKSSMSSNENKTIDSSTQDVPNVIKQEPGVSNESVKVEIKTTQKELNLMSNIPSTSTETDIMAYVHSVTSDINFEEEELIMKEYENNFMKMIRSESNTLKSMSEDREDEEIDVVNGSLEDVSNLFQLAENRAKTTEIPEQQTSTQINNIENVQEEIDVININLPVNEIREYVAAISAIENISTTPLRRNTRSNKRTRNQEQLENELENAEEEIDVVNLPVSEVQNIPAAKSKIRKFNTNMTSSTEDEIIDVVNLTEDTPNLASLSTVLMNSNRELRSNRKLRTNQSDVIDLINTTREERIIEIIDSPVAPRVLSEVINIDDDDNTPQKSQKGPSWGNCPVCFEDLTKCEIMSTMCGHVFCAMCIKTVIKTAKKCPKCRKNLTLKMIHPLFF